MKTSILLKLLLAIGLLSLFSACNTVPELPKGSVVAWYGTSGPIPDGWAICDGTNGTPDLRNRFIQGVSDMASVGKLGGDDHHSHSFSVMSKSPRDSNTTDEWGFDGGDRGKTPRATGIDHRHIVAGATDPASSIPPNVSLIYLMRK